MVQFDCVERARFMLVSLYGLSSMALRVSKYTTEYVGILPLPLRRWFLEMIVRLLLMLLVWLLSLWRHGRRDPREGPVSLSCPCRGRTRALGRTAVVAGRAPVKEIERAVVLTILVFVRRVVLKH